MTAKYLEALELIPLAEIARGTGRAYTTLQAYKLAWEQQNKIQNDEENLSLQVAHA